MSKIEYWHENRVHIYIVTEKGTTKLYVDGKLVGSS